MNTANSVMSLPKQQPQHQLQEQSEQQLQPPQRLHAQEGSLAAAAEQNAQRFPIRMMMLRKGNTEVRKGMCYNLYRRQMDPRWPLPQIIDETVIDRNRLESLNIQRLNPDVAERTHVKCLCTRMLNLSQDWYAHLWDGTILCSNCARCFHCMKLCVIAARKLNSIDGVVLCNSCMLEYGRYRQPRINIKVKPRSPGIKDEMREAKMHGNEKLHKPAPPPPPPQEPESDTDAGSGCCGSKKARSAAPTAQVASAPQNFNSAADRINMILVPDENSKKMISSTSSAEHTNNNNYHGSTERNLLLDKHGPEIEVLREVRVRDDGRRPLRKIYYPNPRHNNYGRPDYRLEAPPYLGVDRNAGYQVCPECNLPAITDALVVPGIARVYHEKSFCCACCKRQLHLGYKLTGVQFEGCNCPKSSMVWCTALKCRQARIAHHTEKKCTLEPFHPGGRPMRDVPGFVRRYNPSLEAKKIDSLNQRRLPLNRAQREKLKRQKSEASEALARKMGKRN